MDAKLHAKCQNEGLNRLLGAKCWVQDCVKSKFGHERWEAAAGRCSEDQAAGSKANGLQIGNVSAWAWAAVKVSWVGRKQPASHLHCVESSGAARLGLFQGTSGVPSVQAGGSGSQAAGAAVGCSGVQWGSLFPLDSLLSCSHGAPPSWRRHVPFGLTVLPSCHCAGSHWPPRGHPPLTFSASSVSRRLKRLGEGR